MLIAGHAHLTNRGAKDQLEERGKLGARVGRLLNDRRIELLTGLQIDRVALIVDSVVLSAGDRHLPPVDEVIAATGFRPDWSILAELRLEPSRARRRSHRASIRTSTPRGEGELLLS